MNTYCLTPLRWLAGLAAATLLAACGGGEVPETTEAQLSSVGLRWSAVARKRLPVPSSTEATYIAIDSAPGEYVGAGQNYYYTTADADVGLTFTGGVLKVGIEGETTWSARFRIPGAGDFLKAGTYEASLPWNAGSGAAIEVKRSGRECFGPTGHFSITNVVVHKGLLQSFDLAFVQYCGASGAGLHAAMHWEAKDIPRPSGLVAPVPANLWTPPPGAMPGTGNFVYLESEKDEFVGLGRTYTHSAADTLFHIRGRGNTVAVDLFGETAWSGHFAGMGDLAQLKPGFYGWLQRWPFHNPRKGGLDWGGGPHNNGCAKLWAWFAVDEVSYDSAGDLESISLRFVHYCEDRAPQLRGAIRWSAKDKTPPPGPANTPTNFWRPPPGAVPAQGSFVYFESDTSHWVGQGNTQLLTNANSKIATQLHGNVIEVSAADGAAPWTAYFAPMYNFDQLQPGFYGAYGPVHRVPFHNPARGGMDFFGHHRGCNASDAWVAVDEITITSGVLQSATIRFEHVCSDTGGVLRGMIRWDASDPTKPPGPTAIPPGLWRPDPGITPAQGNYVYLNSSGDDFAGEGITRLLTPANAEIGVTWSYGAMRVTGLTPFTSGFAPMIGRRIEQGYYGNLTRWPFQNPAVGGMMWLAGCNQIHGWLAVDSVVYAGEDLASIQLRFEQYCDSDTTPLRGEMRWSR